MTKQPSDNKEKIGERLIALRSLTGLTRRAFSRKYAFSENTMRSWEKGLQTGLPRKSAELVINAYRNEYINCSTEWLLTGKGKKPKRKSTPLETQHKKQENPENAYQTVDQEVEFFKAIHSEAAIYTIKDDSMMPDYRLGDIAAGIWHYDTDISKLIDKTCIIETKSRRKLLRIVRASTIPHRFNLYSLNPHTRLTKPHLYDCEILCAAPIVWIRRGEKW